MDVFKLHNEVLNDYANYTRSFIKIRDQRISTKVSDEISSGILWPDPLLQLNPSFQPGASIEQLIEDGLLHEDCGAIFRIKEHENDFGRPLTLHTHQEEAIRRAATNKPYVLTTGTGSGKSLSYIIPIVNHVLNEGSGKGIKAIIVYPMNALANSQQEELDKFLQFGFPNQEPPVTYARYTGQEGEQEKQAILNNPPDIILTNYVMLELILTRIEERKLVSRANELKFLVFDELHTYRGRQGADVAMLIRRCRNAFGSKDLRCVGTSATMASEGSSIDQTRTVAEVASTVFGELVEPENVIGETLSRTTDEFDFESTKTINAISNSVSSNASPPDSYEEFISHPLVSWIESAFGLKREPETHTLIRQIPSSISGVDGAAARLARILELPQEQCEDAIRRFLYAGSEITKPDSEFPVFAFRLHQFISRGDTAWASIEPAEQRHITLKGQQFVPGDRERILVPLCFCRHCGQEYYRIDRPANGADGAVTARANFSKSISDDVESGFLYISQERVVCHHQRQALLRDVWL